MAVVAPTAPTPWRTLQRFLRTPKGLVLALLALLATLAVPVAGPGRALPSILLALVVAAATDLALARVNAGRWILPDGALVTGLIVALLLDPAVSGWVVAWTSALAIASKYVLRTRFSNVFNPAALGLVLATLILGTGQSWWGALPDLPPLALGVLVGSGAYVAQRINKLPMVLAFLGSYFGLFTTTAFLGDPTRVAEIFRAPDLNAALFFAFFMLDDPPTSPVRYGDQVRYALLVAAASFAIYEALGVVSFLPAGLLLGNAWESGRRLRLSHARHSQELP